MIDTPCVCPATTGFPVARGVCQPSRVCATRMTATPSPLHLNDSTPFFTTAPISPAPHEPPRRSAPRAARLTMPDGEVRFISTSRGVPPIRRRGRPAVGLVRPGREIARHRVRLLVVDRLDGQQLHDPDAGLDEVEDQHRRREDVLPRQAVEGLDDQVGAPRDPPLLDGVEEGGERVPVRVDAVVAAEP